MKTRDKIAEARDILSAVIANKGIRYHAVLVRAHSLIESALYDFFSDVSDVAALAEDADDEIVGELGPFPADLNP
jgi:hypothetical protein